MAKFLKATITGENELFRTIDAMKPEEKDRVVSRSLRSLSKELQEIVRTRFLEGPAPRRLEKRTGRTIRSILINYAGLRRGYVDVGAVAELWWLQNYELGRGRRGRRPFMRPAFKVLTPKIEPVFRRNWEREIDRA